MSNDQPDTGGIPAVLPTAAEKNNRGGTHTHKQGCRCFPCQARARREKALTSPVGDGRVPLATEDHPEKAGPVIEADEIVIFPVGRKSHRTKRAIIGDWLRLKTIDPEISTKESAEKLGIARTYLYKVINEATKEGWLRFDDPLARVEHQLVPKVLDNLNQFLDDRDKTVTIEVAKGTLFKTYQEAKGLNQNSQTVLALKIEFPPSGAPQAEVIEGQIVGNPKVLMGGSNEDETQS